MLQNRNPSSLHQQVLYKEWVHKWTPEFNIIISSFLKRGLILFTFGNRTQELSTRNIYTCHKDPKIALVTSHKIPQSWYFNGTILPSLQNSLHIDKHAVNCGKGIRLGFFGDFLIVMLLSCRKNCLHYIFRLILDWYILSRILKGRSLFSSAEFTWFWRNKSNLVS
jgi:hypothetical protein